MATNAFFEVLVTTTAALEPGEMIRSKYRVDRVLGEGGMGWVIAAEHVGLGQQVAIKILREELRSNPELVERFSREARAASRLESDHVCRVLDVDALDDGTPFMVLEYLEGSDLSCVLDGGEPLPLAVAAAWTLEACEAVAEAHALGIVHRDIKPANLFIARRPNGKTRVKVLDFGISKMETAVGASVTSTSNVMGSAHYMSPEQMLASRDVDARADIWALGITLYELTTATLPFPGESVTQVAALVMTTVPQPPSALRPELPAGFDEIVMRCLAPEREDRFESVAELAAALAPFAATDAAEGADPAHDPYAGLPQALAARFLSTEVRARSGAPPPYASRPHASGSKPHVSHSQRPKPLAPRAIEDASSTMGALASGSVRAPARTSTAPALLGGVLVVAAIAAAVLFGMRKQPVATGATPSSEPTTVSAAAAPQGARAEVPPAATSAMPEAPAPTAPSSASARARPLPRPRAATPPAAATPAAAAPAAAAPAAAPSVPAKNCNPPFTINPDGTRHAKPECL